MNSATSFNSSRLTWARLRRGMTQADLATAIHTSVRSLTGYEAGTFAPRANRLKQIAQALHFPEPFFFGDAIDELPGEAASFRSISKRTGHERDRALGSAAVALVLNQTIGRLYALPELVMPVLPRDTLPERAAGIVRMQWSLDEKPIESMVQLLESKGVCVFSLPGDAVAADTFSMWHQDRPYVLLNHRKIETQRRFDAARELGHLILHHHGPAAGRQAQERATNFASAFLMPRETAKTAALPNPAHLGEKWGLPPAVAARRLHTLGLLSAWKHRQHRVTLEQQESPDQANGTLRREKPQLLQRAFYTLRAQGMTKRRLTRTLHIYLEDIDALTFGLATAIFNTQSDVQVDAERLPPRLRIVSST